MPDLDTLLSQRPTFTLDQLAGAANELLDGLLPRAMSDSRVKAEVNPRLIRHYVSEEMLDPALRDGRHAVYTVDHLLQLLALRRLLADGYSSGLIGTSLRDRGRDQLRAIAEGREVHAEVDAEVDAEARAEVHDEPDLEPEREPELGSEGEAGPGDSDVTISASRVEARAALDEIRSRASTGRASSDRASRERSSRGRAASERDRHASAPRLDLSHRSLAAPPRSQDASSATRTWERVPLLDGVELHVRSDLRLPDSMEARQRLLDHVVREIIRYAQRRDT